MWDELRAKRGQGSCAFWTKANATAWASKAFCRNVCRLRGWGERSEQNWNVYRKKTPGYGVWDQQQHLSISLPARVPLSRTF